MGTRTATHAGSWYSSSENKLTDQLDQWLAAAEKKAIPRPIRGIIAPHAGYSYSGLPAAFAYKYIDHQAVKRVFILGPSHHVHLSGCALSKFDKYATPFGPLVLDKQVIKELSDTNKFEVMSKSTDEDEHSIEMHLPYVHKVMSGKKEPFTVVPILVGSTSPEKEEEYGKLLSPYLADPANVFIISSDFCHWGRRFSFTPYNQADGQIFQSIERLDRRGMEIIQEINPHKFVAYLKETKNTICGRHPISVFLNAVSHLSKTNGINHTIEFTKYAQSSQVVSSDDSSVSYAAAICYTS